MPIQIKRRNGRKLVTPPHGETAPPWPSNTEPTVLQLAPARGHRWLAMIESGVVKSPRELARRERVDSSYVSRMVNLTTLAPDIVAAVLDETLPPELTLFDLAWTRRRCGTSSVQDWLIDTWRQNKGFGHSIHYPMLNPNS